MCARIGWAIDEHLSILPPHCYEQLHLRETAIDKQVDFRDITTVIEGEKNYGLCDPIRDAERPTSPKTPFRLRQQTSGIKPDDYPFSTATEVAFTTAKTLSPSFRFIRSTEPVVIIDVTIPAAVRITTSDITLSETIFSIVPGKRFRILMLMVVGLLAFRVA